MHPARAATGHRKHELCGLWRCDWRDADDSASHLRAFTDRSPSDWGRSTMNDAGSIQGDLFALYSSLLTEVRGERSLMAFPFFALSKGKWTKPLAYKTDTVSIEIVATSKGVATIYDKDRKSTRLNSSH